MLLHLHRLMTCEWREVAFLVTDAQTMISPNAMNRDHDQTWSVFELSLNTTKKCDFSIKYALLSMVFNNLYLPQPEH